MYFASIHGVGKVACPNHVQKGLKTKMKRPMQKIEGQ